MTHEREPNFDELAAEARAPLHVESANIHDDDEPPCHGDEGLPSAPCCVCGAPESEGYCGCQEEPDDPSAMSPDEYAAWKLRQQSQEEPEVTAPVTPMEQ